MFRPHQNREESSYTDQQRTAPKVSYLSKRISQKLKVIRSVISSRFFGGKKWSLSILAAAILAAGAFSSQDIAEAPISPTPLTKVVAASIRTSMDSEIKNSMTKNSFLQYNGKAPNNYIEDVSPSYHVFDTPLGETKDTLEEIGDKMDSEIKKFITENSFSQYNVKSPNNYLEDVSASYYVFDTPMGEAKVTLEEIDDNGKIMFDGKTLVIDGKARLNGIIGTDKFYDYNIQNCIFDNVRRENDDLLILNDKMVKNAARNIVIVGGGGVAVLALKKKVAGRISGGDIDTQTNFVDDYNEIERLGGEMSTDHVADHEADKGSLLPLLDIKYAEARKQPKSTSDELILAAKYAAITTVEERAFQILVDLGMVEVR